MVCHFRIHLLEVIVRQNNKLIQIKTLQSRFDDQQQQQQQSTSVDETGVLGEAERKNLVERAEQAEDRALTVSF